MKIDLKKMNIDNENENNNKNKKDLNVYNLKTYIALKILAKKKNQKKIFQDF